VLPRLIASDLDGTLLLDDQTVGSRTAAVLPQVAALTTFVLATGRPPRWVWPVAEALGHQGLAVCANGALVVDLASDEVVYERLLEPAVVLDAAAALRAAVPALTFGVERMRGGFAHDPEYRTDWTRAATDAIAVGPLAELVDGPVVKLLVRHAAMTSDELVDAVRAAVGELVEATHSSNSGLVEISLAGASKAAALAWVAERAGVDPSEAAAFGDMPNDIEMLRWAGHAVAVANAHPLVKAVADEITASNQDEGVAQVLERWLG
jgi:Cof subfamily protein (haloacid dehalogenase superfamily)